jgi:polysaccharide export outer membrane protein
VNNTAPVRVSDDGTANVPLVGKVYVAGLELEGAEQAISNAGVERGVFRDPHVTVTMHTQRINRITVIGAVEKPGVYEIPRGSSSLLAALVSAGGLSKEAGTVVELRRPARAAGPTGAFNSGGFGGNQAGNPIPAQQAAFQQPGAPGGQFGPPGQPPPAQMVPASSRRINLVAAAEEGSNGFFLDDGDVVMVEKRDPEPVQVIGLVSKAGQYELPVNQDLRVLDALAMAGGWSSPVADKVYVIRNMPGRAEPVVIEVSISEAKRHGKGNLLLGPGDIVSVEQTPATIFLDALTRFLHFGLDGTVPVP